MYDWLNDALASTSSCVVTANRRLSRALHAAYNERQIQSGQTAWRRPQIYSWAEWLAILAEQAPASAAAAARINGQQSRVLWEQCLRQDIDDPLINISSLARLCRDTWLRLNQWCVPLAECQSRATGQDQRIFARAAGRYQSELERNGWTDEALLPARIATYIAAEPFEVSATLTMAGFDRVTPQVQKIVDAMIERGTRLHMISTQSTHKGTLQRYDNPEDELRAAGHWAREHLQREPQLKLAIVVNDLEQDAQRTSRILRDGFVPGWQYAPRNVAAALNVSYGRKLSDYPPVHVAHLFFRWLSDELLGEDLSVLLRSPFFGRSELYGRARLELRLREWPDRRWSRGLLLAALQKAGERDEDGDGADWLQRVSRVGEALAEVPERQTPSQWAEFFDDALKTLNWPGDGPLASDDFQLVNRWRDLLNEFSRLGLVSPSMTIREAASRLASISSESIFQPESGKPVLSVLGVLEAAGMEFDKLWVTGLNAGSWPAASRPLPLISRELQSDYGMPDANPTDTVAYAERVLQRLDGSADDVCFSYPALIGDAEQLPAALISELVLDEVRNEKSEFRWHAATLMNAVKIEDVPDRVPAVKPGETIAGGAATINRQCSDPFSAFAYGRLGIRWLPAFVGGIAANIRGSLIHDALYFLYKDCPSQQAIIQWTDEQLTARILKAVDAAFARQFRFADDVLKRLLRLEQQRTSVLLRDVVNIDRDRESFSVFSVENSATPTINGATFSLRCDRIDLLSDQSLAIFDYKTGRTRKFLVRGEPDDLQLVVYALAMEKHVAALALFNVDSKCTSIDGAGPALRPTDDWDLKLNEWKQQVRLAAGQIAAGDARLNIQQNARDARPLSILSRYGELRIDS